MIFSIYLTHPLHLTTCSLPEITHTIEDPIIAEEFSVIESVWIFVCNSTLSFRAFLSCHIDRAKNHFKPLSFCLLKGESLHLL